MIDNDCEITNFINKDNLNNFLNKTLIQISKLIPIYVIECKCDIDQICKDIDNAKGEALDFITGLKSKINKNKKSITTLQKVKKFAKKYELNFIDKIFFNKLSIKAKILS